MQYTEMEKETLLKKSILIPTTERQMMGKGLFTYMMTTTAHDDSDAPVQSNLPYDYINSA